MLRASRTMALYALMSSLFAPALGAEICGLDDRPGATLLLPYFEVDTTDANGVTTFFTVHNTSPEPVLARVVLWTDAAYPTFGFNIELQGFDLQAVDLRSVFEGRVPKPSGNLCTRENPLPAQGFLAAAHTGQASPELGGLCAGFVQEDRIARGFVTIDTVDDCARVLPTHEEYFGEKGIASNKNVLWGDFFLFRADHRRASGDLLLSLEADPETLRPGDFTFYSRFAGSAGNDAREPLPTLWTNRYLGGSALRINSRSIVWRDTGSLTAAFDCSQGPSWFPLPYTEIASIDEQGNSIFLSTDVIFIVEPEPPFPRATQEGVGFRAFFSGSEFLDLNPSAEDRLQSYVMEIVEAEGGTGYIRAATPVDSGCSISGCSFAAPEISRLCIEGPGSTATSLSPGEPIPITVYPRGCFSSSCTRIYRSLCQVRSIDGGLSVDASFCLRDLTDGETACTDDCGGAGLAACSFDAGLDAGDHALRLGDSALPFSVPMEVPAGGICVNLDPPPVL